MMFQKLQKTKMSITKSIIFGCLDGNLSLSIDVCVKSKYLVNLIKKFPQVKEIPVSLTKKHLLYFEFWTQHQFYPPLGKIELLDFYSNKSKYPNRSLEDQIVMCEAWLCLDIITSLPVGFFIDTTWKNHFYKKLGISFGQIENYMILQGRSFYDLKNMLKTLKEFKQNQSNLSEYRKEITLSKLNNINDDKNKKDTLLNYKNLLNPGEYHSFIKMLILIEK